jgi:hypothetical protein
VADAPFLFPAAQARSSRLQGQAMSEAVQPARQRLGSADDVDLAGQAQECGLKYNLSGLLIVGDAACASQHHRTVSSHEQGKGVAVMHLGETPQLLTILL